MIIDWKDFLKPTKGKVIPSVLLIILQFLLFGNCFGSAGVSTVDNIVCGALPIFFFLSFLDSISALIASLVAPYLIFCVIVLLVNKFKKEKKATKAKK